MSLVVGERIVYDGDRNSRNSETILMRGAISLACLLLCAIVHITMANEGIKTIYLIRHAESEENRRVGSLKNLFYSLGRLSLPSSNDISAAVSLVNVPAQVDSEVSSVGKQQIEQLGIMLNEASFVDNIEVVAHSPLKRARQTSEGMLGCSAEGNQVLKQKEPVQRVLELEFLAEKTLLEWVPGYFATFQARLDKFERWLGEQDESSIAIVGHSQYFKAMLGLDFKFGNCDVWQIQYNTSGQSQCTASEEFKTPRGWFGLKRLYSYNVQNDD